jgi:uncharacterized protein (UPF0335 family)
MNNASNALLAHNLSTEKSFNHLVKYDTIETLEAEKSDIEQKIKDFTSGNVLRFGHVVEVLKARLEILQRTLSVY